MHFSFEKYYNSTFDSKHSPTHVALKKCSETCIQRPPERQCKGGGHSINVAAKAIAFQTSSNLKLQAQMHNFSSASHNRSGGTSTGHALFRIVPLGPHTVYCDAMNGMLLNNWEF